MSERTGRTSKRWREAMDRYRPGPSYTGTGIWSPMPAGGGERADMQVDAEVNDIARVVEQRGVASRQRIYRDLNAHTWGPGRFRTAVHQAVADGRIKRIRRGLFAKPSLDI